MQQDYIRFWRAYELALIWVQASPAPVSVSSLGSTGLQYREVHWPLVASLDLIGPRDEELPLMDNTTEMAKRQRYFHGTAAWPALPRPAIARALTIVADVRRPRAGNISELARTSSRP